MGIINESDIIFETILNIAKKMIIAAKTAPKGRGFDIIESKIIYGDKLLEISNKMKKISKEVNAAFFERDANNIEQSQAVVFIGTKIKSLGLPKCGMCGFEDCEAKDNHPNIPCAFNTTDIGIALGSAASIAMDNRIDNRIMYTVGQAVKDLKIFDGDFKIIYGIPLSATSKNPFFDRKIKK